MTLAVEQLLDGDAEAITRKAIAMALKGDTPALRLCMDRIAPVRKGRPLTVELPPLANAESIATAMGAVVEAMARGEISPEEAATIASVIEVKRKAIETGELERRIAALEQQEKA